MKDAKIFATGFVASSRYGMRTRTHVAARLPVLVNATDAQASSAAYVL
jgi:hypothetical protein